MPIKVNVKEGKVTLEVEGMEGPGCKDVMDAATRAAALSIESEDPKDEFHIGASTDATQSEGS